MAEQYQYQPLHAARLSLTDGGLIGDVSMASLAVCHDYHAFSLMRRHLRVRDEPAVVRASVVRSTVETGFSITGPRNSAGASRRSSTVATVEFEGGRLGLYDFADPQYFSYVRSPHVLLRGRRGESRTTTCAYWLVSTNPSTMPMRREQTGEDGDLGGYSLRGISLGERWIYRNPFAGARLSDDEIAIGTSLERMGRYARAGRVLRAGRRLTGPLSRSLRPSSSCNRGIGTYGTSTMGGPAS